MKKGLRPAGIMNMRVDYLKGGGVMAIYAAIINKTARVISPNIRFLLSILPASPKAPFAL